MNLERRLSQTEHLPHGAGYATADRQAPPVAGRPPPEPEGFERIRAEQALETFVDDLRQNGETTPGGQAREAAPHRERKRMQTFSIPADPLEREVLPGRFANVMTQLRNLDSWLSDVFMALPSRWERRRLSDQAWAEQHPDEAEEIVEDLVWTIDSLCAALRSQQAGDYGRKAPDPRRSHRIPQRPRFAYLDDLPHSARPPVTEEGKGTPAPAAGLCSSGSRSGESGSGGDPAR